MDDFSGNRQLLLPPSLPNKRGKGTFYQMLKNSEIVEKGNLNYFELDDYVPPLICVKCCNI